MAVQEAVCGSRYGDVRAAARSGSSPQTQTTHHPAGRAKRLSHRSNCDWLLFDSATARTAVEPEAKSAEDEGDVGEAATVDFWNPSYVA